MSEHLVADVVSRVLAAPRGISFVHRVGGSAGALLASELLRAGRSVLYVTPDSRVANQAFDDLSAFLAAAPLLLPGFEVSPFESVRPDRRLSQLRVAALSGLAADTPRVLVTTALGLIQRTIPRDLVREATVCLTQGDHVSPGALASRLERAGYDRVPLVEDPGTFAVRGDIVDVWSPGLEHPVRLDLSFEELDSIRSFSAESQRSRPGNELSRVRLLPAREALITQESAARAVARMRALCDAKNVPSSRTRLLLEDVESGRAFFAGNALLPAHHDLEPLVSHLGEGTVVVLEQGDQVVERICAALEQARRVHEERTAEPLFAVDRYYVTEPELDAWSEQGCFVSIQSGAVLFGPTSGFRRLRGTAEPALRMDALGMGELAERLASARKSQGGDLSVLYQALETEQSEGNRIVLTARTSSQLDRLGELLTHHGFTCERRAFPVGSWNVALASAAVREEGAAGEGDAVREGGAMPLGRSASPEGEPGDRVQLSLAPLRRGFSSALARLFLLSEEEIFGTRRHRQKRSAGEAIRDAIDDLRALQVGDFVVQREHGIGRYLGLEHREVGGVGLDLLVIEYAGKDKLFLPVYRLNQVQRYSGAESSPRLDRLGGQTFERTKKQATARVRQMADQLLALYAERRSIKRPSLQVDSDEYAAFCAGFPHEETPDQAAAIAEVLADLASDHVMDRLVCGDVGFGKTEVALRAAYLQVLAGRQVAVLCPTTVLAEQHLRTFKARLEGLGASVRVVSRFTGRKLIERTLAELKSGTVDVVVGTHRLLSRDVHFKNLGLLVIDEEQRFGVTHKERIKEIRRSVDVLTLTATPIPRTLSLSIGGVRDMSVIMTPPVDRRSIRTLIARFDTGLIRDAIRRELARNGQIFYVRNRVEGIEQRAAELRSLVPGLRVAVGHGQMSERELEKTMLGFVDGKYDLLIATTIIESGLDIPRANTMLIERSDQFGLAQLYQLRGRVGRSAERAYCYLLLPSESVATDEALKRLEALERYTELGSGFHVATLDMELRGAGELLGQDQSGLLPRVGFELFSQMLEQASAELSGESYQEEIEPELSVDLEAFLPDSYIEEVGLRLSLYKRFASARAETQVLELAEEMVDRFGPPPPEAERYVQVMRLKTELRRLRVLGCNATRRSVTLHLRQDTPISGASLAPLVLESRGRYTLTPDGRLTRRARETETYGSGLEHAARFLLELEGAGGSVASAGVTLA